MVKIGSEMRPFVRVHDRLLWFAIITSFFAEALKCWLVNTGAREMTYLCELQCVRALID